MKACLFSLVWILFAVDAQYHATRCPRPSLINSCRTSCTPGDRPCERGTQCCLTNCGTYDCVRIRPRPRPRPDRRCPRPSFIDSCRTSCTPGDRPCEGGRVCCRTSCGTYDCVRPRGGRIPRWCPFGSPILRCLANPCNTMRCPSVPGARCINDNPCEPDCSGNFYYRNERIPREWCVRTTGRE